MSQKNLKPIKVIPIQISDETKLVNEDLLITKITLDGFNLPIPEGLSELLNRSGAWKYKISDNTAPMEDEGLNNYKRKVVFENGKLRTYLIHERR